MLSDVIDRGHLHEAVKLSELCVLKGAGIAFKEGSRGELGSRS